MDRYVLALLEGLLDQAETISRAMHERMPHSVVSRTSRTAGGRAIGTPLDNAETLVVSLRDAVRQGLEELEGG